VRAAVAWVTAAQATQLTWSEVSYWLGRLDHAKFVIDEADLQVDEIFAYNHRLGALCIEGAPVALAAIPATGRAATALTQEQLLAATAELVIGPGAGAQDLARAIYDDMADVVARASRIIWPTSQHLRSRWTPFPLEAPTGG